MMWTKDRRAELNQLRQLLDDMKMLDHATGALSRLERLEVVAQGLMTTDLPRNRPSFMLFLGTCAQAWPAERRREVVALGHLLDSARRLDRAMGMVAGLRRIEASARALTLSDSDTGRASFIHFLLSAAYVAPSRGSATIQVRHAA